MNVNSLSFRFEPDLYENSNSIVALLPVWAYECEVHPPYERELDAYEDAVLKMVRIEMGVNSIANALNASQSLVGTILSNLQNKGFVEKKKNQGWCITNTAQAYFDGYYQEVASEKAEYGYMFVSALRKDVLPFYYNGSLDKVRLLSGGSTLLRNDNKQDTFTSFEPDNRILRKAYANYRKAVKTYNLQEDEQITRHEAAQIVEDLFAGLDSMDEDEFEEVPIGTDPALQAVNSAEKEELHKERLIVRRLNKPPKECFLRLRIVFDPSVTNGYKVESPFDMKGIDNSWYLRQIQWMMNSDDIIFNNELIRRFLERESVKLGSNRKVSDKDYSVYVLEKMPLLRTNRESFTQIYADFEDIYEDIQTQSTLIDKENIVNQICTKVLESLYRRIFSTVKGQTIANVQKQALEEITRQGLRKYRSTLLSICNLKPDTLQSIHLEVVRKAINNLSFSKGNSILEKMYNLMTLYYLAPNATIRRYVELEDFQHCVELIADLNRIRNSVAHKADYPFTPESYTEFMDKVYPVANRMLKTIVGGK